MSQPDQLHATPTTSLKTALAPVISALQDSLGDDLIALALFGSRARGNAREESDWDLLVIAKQLPTGILQRHFDLKRMLPVEWAAQVSILAKTPAELETYLSSLLLDIALDGVVLYDTKEYLTSRLAHLRRLITEKGLYREQTGHDLTWRWQHFPGYDWSIEWDMIHDR